MNVKTLLPKLIIEQQNVGQNTNVGFVGRQHTAIVVAPSRALPVPVQISAYSPKPTTVQFFRREKNIREPIEKISTNKLSAWYRKRKGLKGLSKFERQEIKRQKKALQERLRKHRESILLLELEDREKEIKRSEKKLKSLSPTISRFKHSRERIDVKPISTSKLLATRLVEKSAYYEQVSWKRRCKNAFYRICCKVYCGITVILVIAGVILYFV